MAALKEVNADLSKEVREGLRFAGQIVQEEGRRLFANKHVQALATAEGFRTYVRAGALVQVEQSLRKTTGTRPDWGALQMTEGLLPAVDSKLDDVAERIEDSVGGLLRKHGF
jgi:hypothetical protein